MQLPPLEKPEQKTNGKLLSKYTPAFVITTVYCQNCKQVAVPNGISYVGTLIDLETLAESLHSQVVIQKRILCGDSKLLFSYQNAFINV